MYCYQQEFVIRSVFISEALSTGKGMASSSMGKTGLSHPTGKKHEPEIFECFRDFPPTVSVNAVACGLSEFGRLFSIAQFSTMHTLCYNNHLVQCQAAASATAPAWTSAFPRIQCVRRFYEAFLKLALLINAGALSLRLSFRPSVSGTAGRATGGRQADYGGC